MAKENKRRGKRKLKVKRIIALFIIIIIIIISIFGIKKFFSFTKQALTYKYYYLSSNTNTVTIYKFDKEKKIMSEADDIYRGKKIK